MGFSLSNVIWYDCVFTWIKYFDLTWLDHQMDTFSVLLALCDGNPWSPVDSPHKCQWHGALMFSLICTWVNSRANNRGASDLRCHCVHYNITVMSSIKTLQWCRGKDHWRIILIICSIFSWMVNCIDLQLTKDDILELYNLHPTSILNFTHSCISYILDKS